MESIVMTALLMTTTLAQSHPDASDMPVVTASNCAYTWSGDVDMWTSGDIGITLTEATTVHVSTCGSEQSTTFTVFEYMNDHPYQMYSSSDATCSDSYYYWNQDESEELDAGHYLIRVEAYSYGAECVQLTVELDGCSSEATDGTCNGEDDFADMETAVKAFGTIIIVIVVAVVLLCIVTPIAICFCCGVACFAAGKKSNQPVAQGQMMQGSPQPLKSEGQRMV